MFKTNESTEIERSYHRLLDSHLSKPFPSLIYLPCTALFIPNTRVFFFSIGALLIAQSTATVVFNHLLMQSQRVFISLNEKNTK